MLVVGAVLVLASAPFDRATWTTFGVLGVFGAALNYASDWFGSWKSPALMVAVSLGLHPARDGAVDSTRGPGRRGSTGRQRCRRSAVTSRAAEPPPPGRARRAVRGDLPPEEAARLAGA